MPFFFKQWGGKNKKQAGRILEGRTWEVMPSVLRILLRAADVTAVEPERAAYDVRMVTDTDRQHLRRCIELAKEALRDGDEPFGSVLVGPDGRTLAEERNRVSSGDRTRHPEFELARWAARHLNPVDRAASTVFTSGEHCPMCAAAHGWVGLGRIVYVASSEQLSVWLAEIGVQQPPIRTLPIQAIIREAVVDGPVADLAAQVHELHRQFHMR